VGGTAALLLAAACSAGSSQPPPDHTLRPIAVCTAADQIPPDVSRAVPDDKVPPTSVLRVGDAVAFSAPAGTTVSSVGVVDDPSGPVVCQSFRGAGATRDAVILGLQAGFVQVGVVSTGDKVVPRVLVTVTG
jgi:hypothetical protein